MAPDFNAPPENFKESMERGTWMLNTPHLAGEDSSLRLGRTNDASRTANLKTHSSNLSIASP